jgi:hypothetical protein
MTKKYSYRTQPSISRTEDEPSWMTEFANNLEKNSVEPREKVEQRSLYDQISSIMGVKSKYPTVEAAVEDMQERSGIKAYWQRVKAKAEQIKQAQDANEVSLFTKCPQIKDTINNCIEDSHGNLSLPSIVERIKTIHRADVGDASDWDDPTFLKYVNDKNIEVKRRHPDTEVNPGGLGKIHQYDKEELSPSNNDIWHSLMPSKTE